MDDTEDDARYPPKPYGMNQGYGSSHRPKLPVRNASYTHQHVGYQHVEDDDEEVNEEEEEEEEEDDDDNDENNIKQNGKSVDDDVDDDGDDDGGDEEEDDDGGDEEEDDDNPNDYHGRIESIDQHKHQKKRKMKSLLSSYEFAPRIVAPSAVATSAPKRAKPSYGGRNSLSDWTEHETFVLLDAWGDRFLLRGRKSLRCEEWQEVAEKVSQESKLERSDTQCRNRLDTLKKKYKKEKMKLEGIGGSMSKWVYFKKMDMLLSSTPQQKGLPHGVDSGEYVNPSVYLNRANGLDEMRDSPGNSVSVEAEENDSDVLPPKRTNRGDGASFRLLADSIQKFSDIYEKIESSKRQQMLELEKMRMDFHRELEMQKRQILERARDEIAKIRQGDEENE